MTVTLGATAECFSRPGLVSRSAATWLGGRSPLRGRGSESLSQQPPRLGVEGSEPGTTATNHPEPRTPNPEPTGIFGILRSGGDVPPLGEAPGDRLSDGEAQLGYWDGSDGGGWCRQRLKPGGIR